MDSFLKELRELLSKYNAEIIYDYEKYGCGDIEKEYIEVWIETPDGDNKEIHWAKFNLYEGITPTSIPYESR